MPKTLIIYHADCTDGFTASWVARQKFGSAADGTLYYSAYHGEQPPDLLIDSNTSVYILDFSYSREDLLKIRNTAKSLTVIDHHKTAEKALRGLNFCIFDMERSGAGLTWDTLFPNHQRPWLVDYVEDRDLWNWKLPNSKAINAYISSLPMNYVVWDNLDLYPEPTYEMIDRGRSILDYMNRGVEDIIRNTMREVVFDGYTVPVVNANRQLLSNTLNKLVVDNARYQFAVGWYMDKEGKYIYSLASVGDFDVSEIAVRHGGGGHKNAAGFQSDKLVV